MQCFHYITLPLSLSSHTNATFNVDLAREGCFIIDYWETIVWRKPVCRREINEAYKPRHRDKRKNRVLLPGVGLASRLALGPSCPWCVWDLSHTCKVTTNLTISLINFKLTSLTYNQRIVKNKIRLTLCCSLHFS